MLRLIFAGALPALIGLFSVGQDAFAQPVSITLEDVLQSALDGSPLVADIEKSVTFAEAESLEVSTLKNPELDIAYGIPTTAAGKPAKDEVDLSLQQPIRFSEGALRTRLSTLIKEAGNREKEKEVLELFVKVKLAYSRVWVLSERERILREVSDQAASFSEFVKSGSQAGAYGEAEALLFRAESAKLRGELQGIEAERLLALSELSRSTGKSFSDKNFQKPPLVNLLDSEIKAKLNSGMSKVEDRLEVLADLAKADAAVAQRDSFPEFRPKLFYSKANDGADILGLGISFDLPFYSQNSAERIKKSAEERSAVTKLNFVRSDQFEEAVLNSVRAHSLKVEQVLLYQSEVLPALKQALKTFDKQVRAGRGDVLEVWQILREYIDTDRQYLELWTETFSKQSELSLLLEEEI